MYHVFIQSSVNGYLGCFHVLTFVNSTAVNIAVHVSFQIVFFSGDIYIYRERERERERERRVGFLDHMVHLYLIFFMNLRTGLHTGCSNLSVHSINTVGGHPFFPLSLALVVYRLFNNGHSDQCEGILRCSFDWHFSDN